MGPPSLVQPTAGQFNSGGLGATRRTEVTDVNSTGHNPVDGRIPETNHSLTASQATPHRELERLRNARARRALEQRREERVL
jgi:hypothetical protein